MEIKAASVQLFWTFRLLFKLHCCYKLIRLQSYYTSTLNIFYFARAKGMSLIFMNVFLLPALIKDGLIHGSDIQILTSVFQTWPSTVSTHVRKTMRVRACLSAHHLLVTSFPIEQEACPWCESGMLASLSTQILGSPVAAEWSGANNNSRGVSSVSLSLYTLSAAAWVSPAGFTFIHPLVRQMGQHRSEAILH